MSFGCSTNRPAAAHYLLLPSTTPTTPRPASERTLPQMPVPDRWHTQQQLAQHTRTPTPQPATPATHLAVVARAEQVACRLRVGGARHLHLVHRAVPATLLLEIKQHLRETRKARKRQQRGQASRGERPQPKCRPGDAAAAAGVVSVAPGVPNQLACMHAGCCGCKLQA